MSDADVVRIRPYAIGDAGALQDAVVESLDELQPWMAWAHPGYTWDEARAWLEVQVAAFEARTEFQFAIVTAADEYLGACGLRSAALRSRRAAPALPASRGRNLQALHSHSWQRVCSRA